MRAEASTTIDTRSTLPIEMRASLDLLYELLAGERSVIRTSVTGDPSIGQALARYGTIEPDRDHPTLLGLSANEIAALIDRDQPPLITALGSGNLQRLIQPLRRNAEPVPRLPSNGWWEHHGYQAVRSIKVQGAGSLFWSACDRLLRRFDRPHLADRCRIAMLRTLVAARRRSVPSTLRIQQYRRTT